MESVNAHVVHVSPKRLQVMRHQASHLGSHAQMTLDELEMERLENEERLKQLEEMYFQKREHAGAGFVMREKMGLKNESSMADSRNMSARKKTVTIGNTSARKDLSAISSPERPAATSMKKPRALSKSRTERDRELREAEEVF